MIHPLDRFFKKKLEQSPHEMEESHWLQALELLEAQDDQRRRKGIPFWFWVILPLAMGALLWSLLAAPGRPALVKAGHQTAAPTVALPSAGQTQKETSGTVFSQQAQETVLPDFEKTTSQDKPDVMNSKKQGRAGAVSQSPVSGKGSIKIIDLPAITRSLSFLVDPVFASIPDEMVKPENERLENSGTALTSDTELTIYSTNLLPYLPAKPLIRESYYKYTGKTIELEPDDQQISPKYPLVMGFGAGARIFPFQSSGRSPMLGYQGSLYFKNKINELWSWNVEVEYAVLKGDLPYTKENQVLQFSFGRQTFDQRLQALSLHNAAAMLSLHRTFGRQTIGLSAGYNRLIGVRGMITHAGAYSPELDTVSYNVPMWIKKDGFNRWNIPVRVNWTYQANHRLSAQVGLGYFFKDMLDSQHGYPVAIATSPWQQFHVEAGIRYALFELKSVEK